MEKCTIMPAPDGTMLCAAKTTVTLLKTWTVMLVADTALIEHVYATVVEVLRTVALML